MGKNKTLFKLKFNIILHCYVAIDLALMYFSCKEGGKIILNKNFIL